MARTGLLSPARSEGGSLLRPATRPPPPPMRARQTQATTQQLVDSYLTAISKGAPLDVPSTPPLLSLGAGIGTNPFPIKASASGLPPPPRSPQNGKARPSSPGHATPKPPTSGGDASDGTKADDEGAKSTVSTDASSELPLASVLKGCFESGGRNRSRRIVGDALSARSAEISAAFRAGGDGSASLSQDEFMPITAQVCGMPSLFNASLFRRVLLCRRGDSARAGERVTLDDFLAFWRDEMEPYDHVERFFRLVKSPTANAIVREDFEPFIEELLQTHPGLAFLKDHREFQDKYALTVAVRIFYRNNMSRSGKITARELRVCERSLLEAFHQVDQDDDINNENGYFSYEHFYVLYCRFWELDFDHDAVLSREDLLKYGGHRLSRAIVDRIFDVAVRPFSDGCGQSPRDEMRYADFVYFMLSEEDKGNAASIQFWFPCVDIDGDSAVSAHDMRFFYDMQSHRMECLGHEVVPFDDVLCQMCDLIKPASLRSGLKRGAGGRCMIKLDDLLRPDQIRVAGVFFDALFSLDKFIAFEQRDPFVDRQKRDDPFDNEWDRFAAAEYQRLALEEEAREADVIGTDEAMDVDAGVGEWGGGAFGSAEAPF